jgi:hypothetical protein
MTDKVSSQNKKNLNKSDYMKICESKRIEKLINQDKKKQLF